MKICVVDLETTGLDTSKANIIEIGAMFVDTEDWSRGETLSALVRQDDYEPLSKEVVEVTGITDEQLQKSSTGLSVAYMDFCMAYSQVDCFVAHNADFDKPIFVNSLKRYNLEPDLLQKKPWVCTIKDLQYPKKIKCRTLSHMALDYGVSVDPSKLHRALDDVNLLVDMLQARGLDWELDFKHASSPDVRYICRPEKPWVDNGVQTAQAKKMGFRWDNNKKEWYLITKESVELGPAPFAIKKDESYGKEKSSQKN